MAPEEPRPSIKQDGDGSLHRPHFIAYVAATIDGRISLATDVAPDWTSAEDWEFFQESLSQADAVVVGHNTYLVAEARLRKRNTFVLSRSIQRVTRTGRVSFVNPDTIDLSELLRDYSTVAVIGGAAVYQFMLEQGLLDEIFVTIEPLIFGRGQIMMSGGQQTTELRLVSVRQLNIRGTLLLHYAVTDPSGDSPRKSSPR